MTSTQRKTSGLASRGATLLTTNGIKIVGVYLAISEARRPVRDEAVLAFCALCVLGAQVVEDILIRLIDRFFGVSGDGHSDPGGSSQ